MFGPLGTFHPSVLPPSPTAHPTRDMAHFLLFWGAAKSSFGLKGTWPFLAPGDEKSFIFQKTSKTVRNRMRCSGTSIEPLGTVQPSAFTPVSNRIHNTKYGAFGAQKTFEEVVRPFDHRSPEMDIPKTSMFFWNGNIEKCKTCIFYAYIMRQQVHATVRTKKKFRDCKSMSPILLL